MGVADRGRVVVALGRRVGVADYRSVGVADSGRVVVTQTADFLGDAPLYYVFR